MSEEAGKNADDILLEDLKKEFLESVSECMIDFLSLIKEKNFEQIEKLAHDIKGTAGVFGLNEGTEIAKKLQYSAKNNDFKSSKN